MIVYRHFAFYQYHGFGSGLLAKIMKREPRTLAGVHRRAPLQVRQGEGALAVAAVGRSEEREQGGILRDWHKLTIAERPALGREVEPKDTNLSDERVGHGVLFRSATGKSRTAR